MPERECMHIIVQAPSLVVCASHECLGLLLRCDIESLIVDSPEVAFNYYISLLLCLQDRLVKLVVFLTHSLTIDHHIARNSLCCIVHDMLLINEAAYLGSQTQELHDAMPVVFVFQNASKQLLVEVEERFQ